MRDSTTAFVGLDVHRDSIAIAVAEPGRHAPQFVGTTPAQLAPLLKALSRLGPAQQVLVAYEAGACGYTLARQLQARGYACEVIAVAKIPRRAAERIKADRRDALTLTALSITGVVIWWRKRRGR